MKWWMWALIAGGGLYLLTRKNAAVEQIAKTIPECRTYAASGVKDSVACFGKVSSASAQTYADTGVLSTGGCVEKLLKEVARRGIPVNKMHIPIGNGLYLYSTE